MRADSSSRELRTPRAPPASSCPSTRLNWGQHWGSRAPGVCPCPAGWPSAGWRAALGLSFLTGRTGPGRKASGPSGGEHRVCCPVRAPAAQVCAVLSAGQARQALDSERWSRAALCVVTRGHRGSSAAAQRQVRSDTRVGLRRLLETVVKEFCPTDLDLLPGALAVGAGAGCGLRPHRPWLLSTCLAKCEGSSRCVWGGAPGTEAERCCRVEVAGRNGEYKTRRSLGGENANLSAPQLSSAANAKAWVSALSLKSEPRSL